MYSNLFIDFDRKIEKRTHKNASNMATCMCVSEKWDSFELTIHPSSAS